jgi:RHS repeat-associated protein
MREAHEKYIIHYNEYYPFNMSTANSWTRENATGNNFLGNGGTELNTTSNLYDLDYRNYDPILGRMHQVDPMATKYASLTPYNYSFNDPVTFSDVSGADPERELDIYDYNRQHFISMDGGGGRPDIMDPFGGSGYGMTGLNWLSYDFNTASTPASTAAWMQMRADARSVNAGSMSHEGYGQKYGVATFENRGIWLKGSSFTTGSYFNAVLGSITTDFAVRSTKDRWVDNWVMVKPRQQNAGSGSNWFMNHIFVEFEGDLSFGPQATFTYIPGVGVVPVPYTNMGGAGVTAKLMAFTLAGIKVNNREGEIKTSITDKKVKQGLGLSLLGHSIEFEREMTDGRNVQNKLKGSALNGLLGVEVNFTTGEVFVGAMPNASWTLGLGVSGEMKFGFMFNRSK